MSNKRRKSRSVESINNTARNRDRWKANSNKRFTTTSTPTPISKSEQREIDDWVKKDMARILAARQNNTDNKT